jgi:S-formylglutathione hydrolase FrmB
VRGWVRILAVLLGPLLAVAAGLIITWRLEDSSAAHEAARTPTSTAVAPGTVSTLSLPAADATGGRRPVWVYRPGVPDSARLPVLYLLHGLPGNDGIADDIGLRGTLDAAFTSGRLRPFVVVAPDGNSTGAGDPEWADSADGSVRVESFVTGELIRAVEGDHRRDRAHRAIAGFSMGGYGAMNLALRHPDSYGQVAALAGYFHTDDPSGVFGGVPAVVSANSPDRQVATAARLRVMLADGATDGDPVAGGETQRYAALLRAAGQHPLVSVTPGGHTPQWLVSILPTAFRFLEQGWSAAR